MSTCTQRRNALNPVVDRKKVQKGADAAYPVKTFVRKIVRPSSSKRFRDEFDRLDGSNKSAVNRDDDLSSISPADWSEGLVCDNDRVKTLMTSESVLLSENAAILTSSLRDDNEAPNQSTQAEKRVRFSDLKGFALIPTLNEIENIADLTYTPQELKRVQDQMTKDIKIIKKSRRASILYFHSESNPVNAICEHGLEKYTLVKSEQQQRLKEKSDVFKAVFDEQEKQRKIAFCVDEEVVADVSIKLSEKARLAAVELGKQHESSLKEMADEKEFALCNRRASFATTFAQKPRRLSQYFGNTASIIGSIDVFMLSPGSARIDPGFLH